MTGETNPRERLKTLGKKAVYYPVFPLAGWTKVAETLVTGGPTLKFTAGAALVTVVWAFAFVAYRRLRDAADDADDALDAVTDGGDP